MWLFTKVELKNESQNLSFSQKKNSNLKSITQQESHLKNGKESFLFLRTRFKKSFQYFSNFSTICEIPSTKFRSSEISPLNLKSKKHRTDKRLQHSQLPQTENGKTSKIRCKKRLNITVLLHGGDLLTLLKTTCRSERKCMLNDTWKLDHGKMQHEWKDIKQKLLQTQSFCFHQIQMLREILNHDMLQRQRIHQSLLKTFQLMTISKNPHMSEQLFTKEQMFACWLKSAEKGKMKWERLDKDYERSCFERWLPHFTQ